MNTRLTRWAARAAIIVVPLTLLGLYFQWKSLNSTPLQKDVIVDSFPEGRNILVNKSAFTFSCKLSNYPTGIYMANEVPAAVETLDSLTYELNRLHFTDQMLDTINLEISIQGNADGKQYVHGSTYDGKLGRFFIQCYHTQGHLFSEDQKFTQGYTMMTNERLCILRGASFFAELKKRNSVFADKQICITVNTSSETGPGFRGVDAILVFKPKRNLLMD